MKGLLQGLLLGPNGGLGLDLVILGLKLGRILRKEWVVLVKQREDSLQGRSEFRSFGRGRTVTQANVGHNFRFSQYFSKFVRHVKHCSHMFVVIIIIVVVVIISIVIGVGGIGGYLWRRCGITSGCE